jgi:hypothetical protein
MEHGSHGLHALPARTRALVALAALSGGGFVVFRMWTDGERSGVFLSGAVLLAAWLLSGVRPGAKWAGAALAALWAGAVAMENGIPASLRWAGTVLAAGMTLALLAETWLIPLLLAGKKPCGASSENLSPEEKRALVAFVQNAPPQLGDKRE